MRILFINSEYPPIGAGAGNASSHLARLLVQMGNEVVVVTAGFAGLPNEETRDGVRILRGPSVRRRIDRSTALQEINFIAGASYRSLKLVREFKPDVVLAFFGLPSGVVAWLLKYVYGVPYVVSLRGGDVPGFRPYDFRLYHRFAAPLLRAVWHGAQAVVANSEGLRDLAIGFDPGMEIPVVPNGVDLERFVESDRVWTPPRLLSVGRTVYQKGLDVAMLALGGIKDIEWEWRVAGDGPQLPVLQAMIRQQQLAGRVQLLGWQKSDELRREYAQANLFLFPSRHEGMPNAVLEAMASGLPVVATRIAGNEELVLDGETGMLVSVQDVNALRDALRVMLMDPGKREQMGRAGRRRVEQAFGWPAAARQYQSILEKAAE